MKTNVEKSNRAAYIAKKPHPMSKVNLDALIARQDFESSISHEGITQSFDKLKMIHLRNTEGNYDCIIEYLKKPDFQRETSAWDKRRIVDIIDSFINGSFIPAVILWQSPITKDIFVIDGAHRISAMIAFINGDYGAGDISRNLYGKTKISKTQELLADDTEDFVNKEIGGSFNEIMNNLSLSNKANGLRFGGFDVQWIKGTAEKAQDSFFKINQQGVVLSAPEKELCMNRRKPTSLATRIIMKGTAGKPYWQSFTISNQEKIKTLATSIHSTLFEPPYNEDYKSIYQHPLAGYPPAAMPMIYEMIGIIKAKTGSKFNNEDDKDGTDTRILLQFTYKLLNKMFSEKPGSLGLFPSIYFYNTAGKFIASSFLAVLELFCEEDSNEQFLVDFTLARARLEDFLIENKIFLSQLVRKYGSKKRSLKHIKGFFITLIRSINEGKTDDEIILVLQSQHSTLHTGEDDYDLPKENKFTKGVRAAVVTKEQLNGTPRCKVCNGYLHPLSTDVGHKQDKKFGGKATLLNGQGEHYYCNNSKDKLRVAGLIG
ncbi:MAG: DUF262 domain-containing protein [Bacteroidetes bacterium]|nr:DUF262 domain-containing protein [Bacteroidota bacterium]